MLLDVPSAIRRIRHVTVMSSVAKTPPKKKERKLEGKKKKRNHQDNEKRYRLYQFAFAL